MKREIRRDGTEDYQSHRGDVETCLGCNHVMAPHAWLRKAHILVLKPACWKSNSVTILTTCPKCFETSWVHYPFDAFYPEGPFPKKWVAAAEAEGKERKAAIKKKTASSLCSKCKKRKDGFNEYSGWRSCERGIGPPETECDTFAT